MSNTPAAPPPAVPGAASAPTTPSFASLGLDAELLRAAQLAGYALPTPVQLAAIPAVLAGRDLRVRAETGSGKTAAFGLPLLQRLRASQRRHSARGNPVAVLVLVPTRELAVQIADVLGTLASALGTRLGVLAVYGGVSANPQMMALRGGVDVLVATPGRLLDLHRQNALSLSTLDALVLDEADRMLSLGFDDELREILALLPAQRQTLLFSATFSPSLDPLIAALLRDPLTIELAATATPQLIEQHVYEVDEARKTALLIYLIAERALRQVLVFVSAKQSADRLTNALNRADIRAAMFHGDKSQGARQRCLDEFRAGKLRVLIATDLAARGLDIEELPVVINYELPRSPNDYAHRIGRTGRAGRSGLALSLVCAAELQHWGVIEKRIKQRLPREHVVGFEPRVPAAEPRRSRS
jgi:superfamily II DNA/RNA helicase